MTKGILLLGLNGCGKTTLGRLLAQKLELLAMDAEDYYFPVPGDYADSRSKEEVHRLMENDAQTHDFVLSCVQCNLPPSLLEHVQLAVVLRVSAELRASRIVQRDTAAYGKRVMPGGDLYEERQTFRAFAASRTEDIVTKNLPMLRCPVVELNAAQPLEEMAEIIIKLWQSPPHAKA